MTVESLATPYGRWALDALRRLVAVGKVDDPVSARMVAGWSATDANTQGESCRTDRHAAATTVAVAGVRGCNDAAASC